MGLGSTPIIRQISGTPKVGALLAIQEYKWPFNCSWNVLTNHTDILACFAQLISQGPQAEFLYDLLRGCTLRQSNCSILLAWFKLCAGAVTPVGPRRAVPRFDVVHDDAPTLTQSIAERKNERRTRITAIHCQKLEMVGGGSGLPLNVDRKLKGNVIVRMRPKAQLRLRHWRSGSEADEERTAP
jgi:hypothetical protein